MKTYLIQTMRISGKSIEFKETEVKAESSEQAIRKRQKRAPKQKIVGCREPGQGTGLYEKSKEIMRQRSLRRSKNVNS